LVHSDPSGVPVSEIMRLYAEKQYIGPNVGAAQRAMMIEALPESWKGYFREKLGQGADQG